MRLPQLSETYHRYVTHLFAGSAHFYHNSFRTVITSRLLISMSLVALLATVFYIVHSAPVVINPKSVHASQNTAKLSAPNTSHTPVATQANANEPADATQHDSNKATQTHNTSVQVNGQDVPLPQNGTVHKVITRADGTTNIDYSSTSSSDGSSSSTNLNVRSSSSSSSDDGQ